MKLTIPQETLRQLRDQFTPKAAKPSSRRRLRGEPRDFVPRKEDSIRNLTPPQRLDAGTITSARTHEITRGRDPIWEERNQLRAELTRVLSERDRLLVLALKYVQPYHHDWQELQNYEHPLERRK